MVKITFIEYPVLPQLIMAYYGKKYYPKCLDYAELLKKKVPPFILSNKKKVLLSTVVKQIEKNNTFGCCLDITNKIKEIHYWKDKNATTDSIIEMISHEIGHAIGYNSEKRACEFAHVSVLTFRALNVINDLKKIIKDKV